jgi:hypothetical protein
MKWKIFVRTTEYSDEVGFEGLGLDGLLSHIATVIVGWDELVSHVVVSNCLLEIRGALVVKDVGIGGDAGAF